MGQRAERVAHLLQHELADLVRELKNPHIQAATLVTVTHVRVSEDLATARVQVSIIDAEPLKVLRAIGRAQGFLRLQIARRLQLKRVPELRFHLDETEARAGHIDALLREVRAEPPVGPSLAPAATAAASEKPKTAPE